MKALYLLRALFVSVLAFEILNLVGILNFEITFSWFGLIITAVAVWGCTEFLWDKLGEMRALKKAWLLFFITASLLLDLFGDVYGWYGQFGWYDRLAHFIGGMVAAIAVTIILRVKNILPDISIRPRFSFSVQLLIVLGIVSILGLLYEFEEYAETIFLNNNRMGDLYDTMDDLLLNELGGIAGGILALRNVHQIIFNVLKKVKKIFR